MPYEYMPLPEPDEPAEPGGNILSAPATLWTRLVTIHPGEYDDEIAVDLSDFALEETDESRLRQRTLSTPEYRASASEPEPESEPAQPGQRYYEALSYVWGSPEDPSSVFVGRGRRVIPITRNLDVAMRHLRYSDRPRVVWIDALCIDQASLGEKSRQVGYMGYVYWSAPRVVVWLGPEADDSHHAMGLLSSVGEKIQVYWNTMRFSCVAEEDDAVWAGGAASATCPSTRGTGRPSGRSRSARGSAAYGSARRLSRPGTNLWCTAAGRASPWTSCAGVFIVSRPGTTRSRLAS